MPTFSYRARAQDQLTSGLLDAPDRGSALRQLKSKGLFPLSLDEDSSSSATAKTKKAKASSDQPILLKRKELQWFTDELTNMLKAGLQLEPALKALASRNSKDRVGQVAQHIADALRDGASFSTALANASPSFTPLFRALCTAGESAGSLTQVLERQSQHLSRMAELRNRITVALVYPSFLMVAGIGVVILFVTYLVPMLSEMLTSGNGEMPGGAKFLIGAADFLRHTGPWLLLGIILLIAAAIYWRKQGDNRQLWDRAMLRLPFAGELGKNYFASQFSQTLATITSGGLPLLRALQLTRESTGNQWYRKRLDVAIHRVSEGADLSRALHDTEEIPVNLIDTIRIGERTGSLSDALNRAGERFEKDLNAAVQRITALIGPALVVGIAIPVGAIAYLMITAIFDTMGSLG